MCDARVPYEFMAGTSGKLTLGHRIVYTVYTAYTRNACQSYGRQDGGNRARRTSYDTATAKMPSTAEKP